MSSYAFRDTQRAARRLLYLAEVFAPLSQPFIAGNITKKPELALDLGCGPGRTTHMVAEATQARYTLGLEQSPHFLQLARAEAKSGIDFMRCDITHMPFPAAHADLIYARFVLAHMLKPLALVGDWATQLSAGGVLLLEEVEWIDCALPVFDRYLEIVTALLAAQNNELYIGPRLAKEVGAIPSLCARKSAVGELRVPAHKAAAMFHMNIQTWREQPFIREQYRAEEIAEIEGELARLKDPAHSGGENIWGMRQMAVEKINV